MHLATLEFMRGFLLHVLQQDLRLSIDINADQGEVAAARHTSVVERAQTILEDHGGPMPLDDLMFSYRDRHRTVRRSRLLDQVRSDNRFVEIDREVWSLREFHLAELEILRPESEILRDRILKSGESYAVTEFSVDGGMSARSLHFVINLLQHDPNLRDLGRGRFCPRFKNHSTIVEELIRDLRRAMGELPFSRFLRNQTGARRRLVSTLLRSNRLFVSPSPDRVDLLENYPFGENRMYRLVRISDDCLEAGSGYTSISTIKAAVNEAGLGGEFLTEFLLEDLLRRNAGYEILPGGIIALQSLGLSSWIQQRVREAIRNAGCALTPQQVLAEEPELAEFGDTLARLIENDPHVHSLDGLRYEVV